MATKKGRKQKKGRKLKKHKSHKKMSDNEKIGVEDLQENLGNIVAGITAQNGFRKTFAEGVVRKLVTDTAQADAVVAELNAGFDRADGKFDVAVKSESEEVDLPEAEDAGDLILDLFKE